MISLTIKVLHRNLKVLIINTLFYSAISLLLFFALYLPLLDVVRSNAFRIESIKNISGILYPICILIFAMLAFLNSISSDMKSIQASIDSIMVKQKRKRLLYVLINLIPAIYSVFFSYVIGFIVIIVVHASLKTNETSLFTFDFLSILLSLIITPLLSVILSFYDIYTKNKSRINIRFEYIPLVLFVIEVFLLIFSTKNNIIAIISYILLIILIPYAVLKLYSYIQLIRSNTKDNKKDYSALLFRRFVKRDFIIYLFLSFALLVIAASNHVYNINKYKEYNEFKLYDYEIDITDEDNAVETLSNEQGIRYTLISNPYNIKLYDDIIPLYFTDLSMISEFLNVKSIDSPLINEEDVIILPSYFKEKYSLVSDEKTMIQVNNKYRYLKVVFIEEATDFIAYAYNISELETIKTTALINVYDKNYDINSLKSKIASLAVNTNSFRKNYDRFKYTIISSSYLLLFSVIGIVLFLYLRLRKDYYDEIDPTLKELYKIPIRNFLVKRMIYHDDFVVLSISTVVFILVEFLIIGFYTPNMFSSYYIFFKDIKFQEFMLYMLIIYVFFNVLFFIEYLYFNLKGDKYEKEN